LLGRHQGSLDAVALAVQIHLSQNRTDLAVKEAKSARSLGQDALLVNLAESWVGVRQVCFLKIGVGFVDGRLD
jgi:coatomer protein complex subunit epsilon